MVLPLQCDISILVLVSVREVLPLQAILASQRFFMESYTFNTIAMLQSGNANTGVSRICICIPSVVLRYLLESTSVHVYSCALEYIHVYSSYSSRYSILQFQFETTQQTADRQQSSKVCPAILKWSGGLVVRRSESI